MPSFNGRSYEKDAPVGESLPLVICLHGGGGSGSEMRTALNFSSEITDKAVFIYPSSETQETIAAWNAGPRFDNGVDDLVWLEGLIEQVKADEDIDGSKVYIVGHSNGGMMAHRYASVKGSIAKMFIFNSALVMIEDYTYTGELSLWKSDKDEFIPPIGNSDYRSFVYEFRQMNEGISERSEFRIVGGAGHNITSFKQGLERLGTTLEAEVIRFLEL